MQHQGTKTIETDRLILRKLTMGDVKAIFSNWACDPDVTKFLTWQPYEDIRDLEKIIGSWVSRYNDDDFYFWGIVLKEDGDEPIGTISVVKMDESIGMVEIGYCISKKCWHSGVTSEALAALIDYFFKEIKVNRIQARHDTNNENSGKVMKKCGMQFEGIMRQAGLNNQGIVDSAIYAILSKDYI